MSEISDFRILTKNFIKKHKESQKTDKKYKKGVAGLV